MSDSETNLINKKKKSLKRYTKNLNCIARLEERLFILINRIEGVGSSVISDMPRGTNPKTKDELITDKIELEKRLVRLKTKSLNLKEQTYNEIDKLDDIRYKEVLECMFIDGLNTDEVADALGYNTRHIDRLYQEAMKELIEYDN